MKIKIVKASMPTLWYAEHIGKIFDAEYGDFYGEFQYKTTDPSDGEAGYVYKDDAEVVTDLSALESELAAMKAKVAEMERQLAEVKKDAPEDRLKVGDYAKIAEGIDDGYAESGDIVEIIGTGWAHDFKVRKIGDTRDYTFFNETDLRRATDEEVAEAKRKLAQDKIQPGVYVKLQIPEGSRPRYGWGNVKNGDIGKVTDRDGELVYVDFPKHPVWRGVIHEFVLVTEEERKQAEEAAKWAAIGRKPGEFKVGDIVRHLRVNPEVFGVITHVYEAGAKVKYQDEYGNCTDPFTAFELVAPVESVVNLRVS